MKKVYKFATGEEIPEGAIYLFTRIQRIEPLEHVWHYFLVKEDKGGKQK